MNVLSALLERPAPRQPDSLRWLWDYFGSFSYQGNAFPLGLTQTLQGEREAIAEDFVGYVQGAFKRSSPVFAVMLVRMLLFSEARFMYRRLRSGRPGDLFSTRDLDVLRNPWPNGTTGDLLTRVIQDADLAGNFYGAIRSSVARGELTDGPKRIRRMRPDWTEIVIAADDPFDVDAEIVGYEYFPGGKYRKGAKSVMLQTSEVIHYSPIPDPEAQFRGMSWLSPVLREIAADNAATSHKLKFFENGATPNMVVKLNVENPERFKEWVKLLSEKHDGVHNAYKTLYLGGGSDVTVVGKDLQQLDFKATQGAGESRIASAGGIHPVILGFSEGLQGSSLNAGNYAQAKRRVADGTLRPLWRSMCASFAPAVPVPADAELWFDDRDIAFLREDEKDAADIQSVKATTIRTLTDGGFSPVSVIAAVTNDDLTLLEHTGKLSVQLQEPGAEPEPANAPDAA